MRRPLGRHYVELTRADFRPLHQWITVGHEPGELHAALVHAAARARRRESAPVEIESMVRRRGTQIRACYERRLKRDPSLAGTVSLRLRVGDAGQVTRVDVEELDAARSARRRVPAPRGRRLELHAGAQRHRRLPVRLPHAVTL